MDANIPGFVLAAGQSRRMGQCKALLILDDKPVVWWHVMALQRAGYRPIVVSDEEHERIRTACPQAQHLHLADAVLGSPIQTLRRALLSVPTPLGALVMPVDIEPPYPATLRCLIPHEDAVPVGPDGIRGHPVRLCAATCDSIRKVAPAGGLRDALTAAAVRLVHHPVSRDFDTPAVWEMVRAQWDKERGGG